MSMFPAISSPSSGTPSSADVLTVTISDEFFANLSQPECEQQERARQLYANGSEAGGDGSGSEVGSSGCPIAWDGLSCWPTVPPSSILQRSCRLLLLNIEGGASTVLRSTMHHLYDETFAYRRCDSNGHWVQNTTNYNACIALISQADPDAYPIEAPSLLPVAVSGIVASLSLISLVLLTLAAIIFSKFTVLACSRTRVHTQLVFALALHSFSLLFIAAPVVIGHLFPSARLTRIATQLPWACKLTLCVKLYSSNASINWMFVEGHLLHSRVSTQVFKSSAPFRAYYTIGWGLPLAFVLPWALVTELSRPDRTCWEGYAMHPAVWLLIAPRLIAVLINSVFLVNIVRILISKAKADLTENSQFRAALKATLVLFPLLGLTHLLFAINPHDSIAIPRLKETYLVLSAAMQSSQGIFVSVIHCFMNGEVQDCLRTAYIRASLRRNPNRKVKSSSPRFATVTSSRGHPSVDQSQPQGHQAIKSEGEQVDEQNSKRPAAREDRNSREFAIREVRPGADKSTLRVDATDSVFGDPSVHVVALSGDEGTDYDSIGGSIQNDVGLARAEMAQV